MGFGLRFGLRLVGCAVLHSFFGCARLRAACQYHRKAPNHPKSQEGKPPQRTMLHEKNSLSSMLASCSQKSPLRYPSHKHISPKPASYAAPFLRSSLFRAHSSPIANEIGLTLDRCVAKPHKRKPEQGIQRLKTEGMLRFLREHECGDDRSRIKSGIVFVGGSGRCVEALLARKVWYCF